MIDKRLQELLEFAESTDLQELVWEKKGAHISFRRPVRSGSESNAGRAGARCDERID